MKSKQFLNDIKKLSVQELQEKRRSLSEELMKLRFKQAIGQLEKGHVFRELKRDLARVETMISAQKTA